MSTVIESRTINGHLVNVVPDDDPPNPRDEYDQLGTILYVFNKYLNGSVYGFEVVEACKECGHKVLKESCYGFYSIEDAFEAAAEFCG